MQNEKEQHPWWKSSIIYQVYPQSFMDSNGDGIGDLQGLIQKLDYIVDLGVNTIWLNPIYESPLDDNGYDISDYLKIHPRYGTMNDFEELLAAMHAKELKLLMDLVVNHCSDDHMWFKEARKSKDNPYRDFFFWRKGKDGRPPNNWKSFFGGSTWEYNEATDDYYLHLFTKRQPDLNWENPKVREEVYNIMRFWLEKGIDGFRMDVISLISKDTEFPNSQSEKLAEQINQNYANGPRIHEFLQEMNRKVLVDYNVLTVGEGPGITDQNAHLYVSSERKELSMIFQLEHMFLNWGDGGRFDPHNLQLTSLKEYYTRWNKVFERDGWITSFLDNHDFARLLSRFGNDREYRVKSAKLFCTLILTMPGTPSIYFGSEIGMTNVVFEHLSDFRDVESLNFYHANLKEGRDQNDLLKVMQLEGRDNVRTPMPWDDSLNGGFTGGEPWIKMNPNYDVINVVSDSKSDDSILAFYKEMITIRKSNPGLTFGNYQDLMPAHDFIFCFERKYEETKFLVLLNLSDNNQKVGKSVDLSGYELMIGNYEADASFEMLHPWQSCLFKKE